jgi:hypothetical protein
VVIVYTTLSIIKLRKRREEGGEYGGEVLVGIGAELGWKWFEIMPKIACY